MSSVDSLLRELDVIRKSGVADSVLVIDHGRYTLKARIFIRPDLFVQVYRNDRFNTTSFALVLGNQRIYGRDLLGGSWHRHPFEDPGIHQPTPEEMPTLLNFWRETEELLSEIL